MIDRKGIVEKIDCRDLVESEIGKPNHHSSKANIYKCLFHHEHKGESLAIYADGWKCFGACNTSGDAVAFLEKRHGWHWKESCKYLVERYNLPSSLLGDDMPRLRRHRRPAPRPAPAAQQDPAEPPPVEWQLNAAQLVELAEETLWSPVGEKARHYLRTQRGFTPYMIKNARLGYIPADRPEDYKFGRVLIDGWELDGKAVRAHCGITIPHFADNNLWAVRIRRPPGIEGPKYMGIRGGSKALYWIDEVYSGFPVVIVEGEFDALCLDIAGFNYCCPVAIASASNKNISNRWLAKLMGAPVILARMDSDGAGQSASETLQQLSGLVRLIQVPDGYKDVNELFVGAGREAVRVWIEDCLK